MTTETINGNKYDLKPLTRGQVRAIEAEAGSGQTDMLVQLTVDESIAIDDLPMPDFVEIVAWAIKTNGLDGSAIEGAKKN